FRKDLWVRGARSLTPAEQVDGLRRQAVVLAAPKDEVTLKAAGPQGEMILNEDIYRPVLDLLGDHKVVTIGELEKGLQNQKMTFGQLVQAVTVLAGKGVLQAAQDADAIAQSKPSADRLNQHMMNGAVFGKEVHYFASPVTGGALITPRFHQMFAASVAAGKKKPAEWARDVWAHLAAQGQKIVKDGKALETPEENMAELNTQATGFGAKRLPLLKALGIV
ncbi:MAG: methyltransferase, partial [Ramlibacter sp.]